MGQFTAVAQSALPHRIHDENRIENCRVRRLDGEPQLGRSRNLRPRQTFAGGHCHVWTAPFVQGLILTYADLCGLRSCVRPALSH